MFSKIIALTDMCHIIITLLLLLYEHFIIVIIRITFLILYIYIYVVGKNYFLIISPLLLISVVFRVIVFRLNQYVPFLHYVRRHLH